MSFFKTLHLVSLILSACHLYFLRAASSKKAENMASNNFHFTCHSIPSQKELRYSLLGPKNKSPLKQSHCLSLHQLHEPGPINYGKEVVYHLEWFYHCSEI